MTRLADPAMTPAGAAMLIGDHRQIGERAVELVAERSGLHHHMVEEERSRLSEALRGRGQKLLDDWEASRRSGCRR